MNDDWTVLLIGGSSGVGKSYLARQLAKKYEIPLTEIDDIRIAIRTVANRLEHPDLFTFVDHPDYLAEFTSEYFTQKLIDVGLSVWPALDVLLGKHIGLNERAIFEGDGIIPELLATRNREKIKAIFLYDDLEQIKERQFKRNRNPNRSADRAENNSLFSYAYSEELRKQAESHGFTTIKASPVETLLERVVVELGK
jgi:2-phosphoglycerate kinase